MKKLTLFVFFLLMNSLVYALPFGIVPKAGTSLPTSVNTGSTATAYYTVSNNTISQRTGNYAKYLPPNTTQVTTSGTYPDTCGSTFTLAAKGASGDSCTLQLSVSGPIDGSDTTPSKNLFVCFPGGITCAGTLSPLNVTQQSVTTSLFTYVGNFGDGTFSVCPINSDGSLGTCNTAQSTPQLYSFNITINPAGTYIYLDDATNDIYYCPLNSNSGTFGTCNPTTPGSTFNSVVGHTISPSGAYAYIANSGTSSIFYCAVNSNGSFSGCSGTGSAITSPSNLAINPAGTFLYVTRSGGVSYCPINSNGTLGSCTNTGGSGFNSPFGITINSAGTFAYIANNGANNILVCSINSNGSFGTCTAFTSGTGTAFSSPGQLALNATNTIAYVASYNNSKVFSCPINSSTGGLGTCQVNSDVNFSSPIGLAVR